tara:strand:+ start:8914 stop:9117 length:204 start_codon:yes stop_codon:yes gene_type:complete
MSGEWKMPIFENNIGTIRLNPNNKQDAPGTIHIALGSILNKAFIACSINFISLSNISATTNNVIHQS